MRALGFENPATLCYELESAGVPLWRVERRTGPGCAVALGVRVAPQSSDSHAPQTGSRLGAAERAAHARTLAGPAAQHLRDGVLALVRPSKRLAAIAIALLALLAVAGWTLALTEQSSNPRAHASLARARAITIARSSGPHTPGARLSPDALRHATLSARASAAPRLTQPAAPAAPNAGASQRSHSLAGAQPPTGGRSRTHAKAIPPSHPPAPAPAAPPASAAELQAQGHQLLGEGRYATALSYLNAALAASGGSVGSCATPSTQACLTYAYALLDLGRALWLSGEKQAAIGELEMRLRIDNQRQTVLEEIARVRSSKS